MIDRKTDRKDIKTREIEIINDRQKDRPKGYKYRGNRKEAMRDRKTDRNDIKTRLIERNQ